jgi:hypothetical protein
MDARRTWRLNLHVPANTGVSQVIVDGRSAKFTVVRAGTAPTGLLDLFSSTPGQATIAVELPRVPAAIERRVEVQFRR